MHIIILGGSGFIGSALSRALATRGDSVTIPRRSLGTGAVTHSNTGTVQSVQWDGQDAVALHGIVNNADAVINLLGENIAAGRWSAEVKNRIVHSRLQAGAALVQAVDVCTLRPKVLIQASACGYYGSWADNASAPICTEDMPAGFNFLATTAIRWELSTQPVEDMGVRRCIIRTAPVLGPHGGMLQKLVPLFQHYLGGPTGDGRQPFSWIHLHDEVQAILYLLDHPTLSGPFNLAAPNPVTMNDFARCLGRALHRPALLRVPAFAARLALGEMAQELLLTGQYAVPERLLEAGFVFDFPHLFPALIDCVAPEAPSPLTSR